MTDETPRDKSKVEYQSEGIDPSVHLPANMSIITPERNAKGDLDGAIEEVTVGGKKKKKISRASSSNVLKWLIDDHNLNAHYEHYALMLFDWSLAFNSPNDYRTMSYGDTAGAESPGIIATKFARLIRAVPEGDIGLCLRVTNFTATRTMKTVYGGLVGKVDKSFQLVVAGIDEVEKDFANKKEKELADA